MKLGRLSFGILFLCLLFLASCARAPLKGASNALKLSSAPELTDDLELSPLLDAIERQIGFLEANPGYKVFTFGEDTFTKAEYLDALKHFVELGRGVKSKEEFLDAVRDSFNFYIVYGQKDDWGDAFFTSYYEVVIPGSLKRTKTLTQPLYTAPDDLVTLDLSQFDEKYKGDRKLRGHVVDKKFVPYFTREEIDTKQALKGRKLEIVWVDPIDAFLLHVQGSGTIQLPKGKTIRLGYAEKNGQRYESIAKFFKDLIAPEDLNLHTVEAYLRKLPEAKMREYLNKNPSYVFFQVIQEPALTYMGLPATDGRTIATDSRYFPKGAIAYISSTKPKFEGSYGLDPKEWQPFGRFVLDQDVGGAITGAGRADIFWGRGFDAKRYAGVMKQWGRMYYLAPKKK